MTRVTAAVERHVPASPELVLEIIRDFDGHHRHILPKAFSDFRVVEGGVGAGTVTSFVMTLGGRSTAGRTRVSEPQPGVVREDVEGRDMITYFRVRPSGTGSRVDICTSWTPDSLVERLVAPALLRRVYRQELALLAAYARRITAFRAAAVAV